MASGTPALAAADLARLRRQLEARRAELGGIVADETAALADPLGTEVPAAEAAGDREAAASELRDVAATLSQAHRAELEAVEAALARIDDGEYGLCESCGTGIAAARLVAQPTARRCVRCQDAAEHGRRPASL